MCVTVDDRERLLINELNRLKDDPSVPPSCKLVESPQVARLPLGDIQVATSAGAITLLIERKTLADFAASIIDSRFRDQRQRLIEFRTAVDDENGENTSAPRIMYIVEGALEESKLPGSGLPQKPSLSPHTICGAIANLVCRDEIHVIRTRDTQETAVYIAKLATAASKFAGGTIRGEDRGGHVVLNHVPRSREMKQADRPPAAVFAAQLMQISRVGEAAAKAVAHEYQTSLGFIRSYLQTGRDAMHASLRIINIHDNATGGRKIGPAVADRILDGMTGPKIAPSV